MFELQKHFWFHFKHFKFFLSRPTYGVIKPFVQLSSFNVYFHRLIWEDVTFYNNFLQKIPSSLTNYVCSSIIFYDGIILINNVRSHRKF